MATNKGGRPTKHIDLKLVEDLANIQCTQEEIASVLKVSVRTLQRSAGFCRVYKEAMEHGKSSLRRLQWKSAQAGNATILIWLGKQYLNQKDRREIDDLRDDPNKPTVVVDDSGL